MSPQRIQRDIPQSDLTPYHAQLRAAADDLALARNKRFTDAELAAELFRQTAWLGANGRAHATDEGRNIVIEAAFTFGPITRDEHEWLTLSHFVALPHYDKEWAL